MKKIIILLVLLAGLYSCRPIARSWRGDEVEVNGERMCVWHTYVFDRKTNLLIRTSIDTMPCNTEYVTTYKTTP